MERRFPQGFRKDFRKELRKESRERFCSSAKRLRKVLRRTGLCKSSERFRAGDPASDSFTHAIVTDLAPIIYSSSTGESRFQICKKRKSGILSLKYVVVVVVVIIIIIYLT